MRIKLKQFFHIYLCLLSTSLISYTYAAQLTIRGTTLYRESENRFPKNWHHLDRDLDDITGISTNIAYHNLKNQQSQNTQKIIVAIIDSGVDINHIDLRENIWINHNEIPNNNIDDDNNGYIDDIVGWNFLGNAKAMATFHRTSHPEEGDFFTLIRSNNKQHFKDTLEITREVKRLQEKSNSSSGLTEKEKKILQSLFNSIKSKRARAKKLLEEYQLDLKVYSASITALKKFGISINNLSTEKLKKLKPQKKSRTEKAIAALLNFIQEGVDLEFLNQQVDVYYTQYEFHYNQENAQREILVNDSPDTIIELNYGNNDVTGPNPLHGTHIAGIIGAKRDNGIGINGITSNVEMMILRAIPDGDERDKDIVNAIYYAIANGAKIINMSFGKYISPHAKEVEQALLYAKEMNVLIVQASGNDYKNIDQQISYPNSRIAGDDLPNYITVGASTPNFNETLFAGFSNYGKNTVDILAPGSYIYSTLPNNKYAAMSGTSMAAPIVTGIACALLVSDPTLSAIELKKLIIESSYQDSQLTVFKPGVGNVMLADLIKTPGVVNLNRAFNNLNNR